MALSRYNHSVLPRGQDPFELDVTDYAIGGKLVAAQSILSYAESMHFKSDDEYKGELKRRLVAELVEAMIDNKLVEVTYETDHASQGYALRARAYLAPDSQVKILRHLHTK